MAVIKLLDKVSANTVGNAVAGDGGGKTLVITAAALGGGTITVEFSDSSKTYWAPAMYKDSIPFAVTATGAYKLEKMGAGVYIRATLSSATSPSNVSVELSQ